MVRQTIACLIKKIEHEPNVKIGNMIEAWFTGSGPLSESSDKVEPPQVVTEIEWRHHNKFIKCVCPFRKISCPVCALDYRTCELVELVEAEKMENDPRKVTQGKPAVYTAEVQKAVEEAMITHVTRATHFDESVEIPEGRESQASTEALLLVSSEVRKISRR